MNWIDNTLIGGIKNQIHYLVAEIWDDKVSPVNMGEIGRWL